MITYLYIVQQYKKFQLKTLCSFFQKEGFKKRGGESQQTGELAGNFYCLFWRRTTSSSSVYYVPGVLFSTSELGVKTHAADRTSNIQQPLKTSVRVSSIHLGFPPLFFFSLGQMGFYLTDIKGIINNDLNGQFKVWVLIFYKYQRHSLQMPPKGLCQQLKTNSHL